MKFASALTILAGAFVAQASTVANVLSDIATITKFTTSLDNQIVAFPLSGGSLTAALAIHSAAAGLVTNISTGTNDANNITPLPVSLSDATNILTNVSNLKPIILSTLTDIVTKKPGFVSLPVGGLVALIKSDLQSLNTSTIAFEVALLAKTPASLQGIASSITSTINAAFVTAIAAYSSS